MVVPQVVQQRLVFCAATLTLPALLLAFPVAAQSDRSQNSAATTQGSGPTSRMPEAPIGHRQPTVADVAVAAPQSGAEIAQNRRDKALDKKLQICRGC